MHKGDKLPRPGLLDNSENRASLRQSRCNNNGDHKRLRSCYESKCLGTAPPFVGLGQNGSPVVLCRGCKLQGPGGARVAPGSFRPLLATTIVNGHVERARGRSTGESDAGARSPGGEPTSTEAAAREIRRGRKLRKAFRTTLGTRALKCGSRWDLGVDGPGHTPL